MNEQTQALTVREPEDNPGRLMRRATDVAGVCKEIVLRTAQRIGNKQYVKVEGWEAIAAAHGCVASARDVEKIEGGFRAIGEVRRTDNGAILGTAEGFVGDDEEMWAKRPVYARRAMAQTRAISRACRSCFAHVVVLIDSNLSTTPAEEVPDGGFQESQRAAINVESKTVAAPTADGETKAEATLVKVEKFTGTAKTTGKPWTRWGITLQDKAGATLVVGTFDSTMGQLAETMPEKESVIVSFKPGRKEGTFDLTHISPAKDDVPM